VPFAVVLARYGLQLNRDRTTTLQINVGPRCNQRCLHCHLDAGPHRDETMDPDTLDEVVAFARRNSFQVIDITGGAPEMFPHLIHLIRELAPLCGRLMVRSNLTALASEDQHVLLDVFRGHGVVVVASLPSTHPAQVDAQRGSGVMERSLGILRTLNAMGYGIEGSGLELHLVSNPTGAFLPPSQAQAEKKFRQDLGRKWGIAFNALYTFANAPLGRFGQWLEKSGNLNGYMQRLASGFNPCAVSGLMCRTLLSVSWEGYLFDCDFNLARGLFMGGRRLHVSGLDGPPAPGTPIAVGDHCYVCTAGSGFT
jgi:radical SAM/Cys-rich protein